MGMRDLGVQRCGVRGKRVGKQWKILTHGMSGIFMSL